MSAHSKPIKKSRLCSHASTKDWGNYWPQGLVIEINKQLTTSEKSQDSMVVLLHEYLHFLQNTTTLFGMQSFIADWSTLFSIVKVNKQASKIRMPIKDQSGCFGTQESWFRDKLFATTYGDTEPIGFVEGASANIINIKYDENCKILYQGNNHVDDFRVPSCTLEIQQGKQHLSCEFGALAIYESLAALLEDALVKHYSHLSLESLPTFPYRALQYAAEYFEKRNSQAPMDRITLARIADRSLMTTAPGFFAARYLEEQTVHPKQPVDETVNIVNTRYPWFKYDALISTALKDLKTLADKFSISPIKKEIFQWFKNHVETSLAARKNDPDVFIRPLISDDPLKEWCKLLSNIPIPIIHIDDYGYHTLDLNDIGCKQKENTANNAAPFFRQLQFVINLHVKSNQEVKCPAHRICSHSFKNTDCLNKPWKYAEHSTSCETGSAFAFLGVKGKKVKCYHRVQ